MHPKTLKTHSVTSQHDRALDSVRRTAFLFFFQLKTTEERVFSHELLGGKEITKRKQAHFMVPGSGFGLWGRDLNGLVLPIN